jgi:hypothetical protein
VFRGSADATDGLGVAVAVSDGEAFDSVSTDGIRNALVRRYGFAPALVTPVRPGEWPLTATGKIDRKALAERAAKGRERSNRETGSSPDSVDEENLALLWREALNLGGDFGRDDNFFDCGGDSLRAAALLIGADKRFKRRFDLREFFALPTFNTLLRLVQGGSAPAANDQQTSIWPLTEEFRRRLLPYIEGWSGERVSEDRLMFGANREGSLPPLFCVINAEYEFTNLAEALGPERPVYAFRSLYSVREYNDEDLIQALALGYVKDLEKVHPDGPLFLLAHCQGCDIAIAMAQHLLRRGRQLPLLVLIEWMMEPVSFPGDVLLIYGRDSEYHPKFASFNPEPAWRRMFGQFSLAEIDGGHDIPLDNVPWLAGELTLRFAQALDRSHPYSPLKECAFEFAVGRTPGRSRPGARLRLEVSVKNIGKATIGGESSTLRLGGCWTRDGAVYGARFVEATPLPTLAPGDVSVVEMPVIVPEKDGTFELALDLFEQRGHALTALGAAPSCATIKVTHRATPMRESLRPYFRRGKADRRLNA